MATLTVGSGQQYQTIESAVAASSSGDTIDVSAGTYSNNFIGAYHSLTIQAVGGAVNLVATIQPPNGKGIIDEGGTGVTVTLDGLAISGAVVSAGNGAGVRYEGGTLVMNNDTVSGNQDGLLANPDPAGAITINNSTFTKNGAGDGYTHNIYAGAIASLTVENSTISNAVVGHDIKSRAASTTITGNTITDTNGTASYEVDLPNGGVATISNNTIEKGVNASNPIAISYGEEGSIPANSSLTVSNNLLVNDYTAHYTTAVQNDGNATASVTGNTFYGWATLAAGPANLSGNTVDTTEPALTSPAAPKSAGSGVVLGSGPDSFVLNVSEDAWQGDAQFTVAVDGTQMGGVQTATASHSAGQTQAFTIKGTFGASQHAVTVSFLNDAYGGSPSTDRNLYVDSLVDGQTITAGAALYSNGSKPFFVGGTVPVSVGSGPQKIVLQMAEDAYNGDAQFSVAVDGQRVGGTLTATAFHGAGQMQEFDINGAFAAGSHQVAVSFLNDAYGGTSATDRNLYVDKIGANTVNAALYSNGTQTFTTIVPST